MSSQANIVISGFPRSGNTFLEVCLNAMYKNVDIISDHDHTVAYLSKKINNNNMIISPLRNPLDAIPSYFVFRTYNGKIGMPISMDIKFYNRYINFLYNNFDKLLILDFDIFTKSPEYISNLIHKKFNIINTNSIDFDLIYEYMEKNKEMFFYKRKDMTIPEYIKKSVNDFEEIKESLIVYDKLKNRMEDVYGR